jgi:hypothetical protein
MIGRLIFILIALILVVYLIQNYHVFSPRTGDGSVSTSAPLQKARALERQAKRRKAEMDETAREAEQTIQGPEVSENMTPDQVRSLLGPPDEVETGTSDTGKSQERWIYRQAGKTVIFEDGVAVSVK